MESLCVLLKISPKSGVQHDFNEPSAHKRLYTTLADYVQRVSEDSVEVNQLSFVTSLYT